MGKGGESSTAKAEPLPAPGSPGRASLTSDAAFAPFLDASFNATEFASAALAQTHMSAAAQTHQMQVWARILRSSCVNLLLYTCLPSQLHSPQLGYRGQCINAPRCLWPLSTQESIRRLNSILRSEVISKQPELLTQVGHLREAEPALRRITSAADGLQAELRRACSEVQEPYLRIRRDTVKLRNLQGTVELLRHTMQRWGRQMGHCQTAASTWQAGFADWQVAACSCGGQVPLVWHLTGVQAPSLLYTSPVGRAVLSHHLAAKLSIFA